MKMSNKIEIKYLLLALIAIPPFFAGFIPIEWLCNAVPDGVFGLLIVFGYVLILGGIVIKYEEFLLKKYYKEIDKYNKS